MARNGASGLCTTLGAPVKSFWVDPSACVTTGHLATWQGGINNDHRECGVPVPSPNGESRGLGCPGAVSFTSEGDRYPPSQTYCENTVPHPACPSDFPFLERHTTTNFLEVGHGDVCRKQAGSSDGGYECVTECTRSLEAPHCKNSFGTVCRAGEDAPAPPSLLLPGGHHRRIWLGVECVVSARSGPDHESGSVPVLG